MKSKWMLIVFFVLLMISGGLWIGSGGPSGWLASAWDGSRQALDDAADRAAIICTFIALVGLGVLIACFKRLGRIEKKMGGGQNG